MEIGHGQKPPPFNRSTQAPAPSTRQELEPTVVTTTFEDLFFLETSGEDRTELRQIVESVRIE